MELDGKLRAWVEPGESDRFVASFVCVAENLEANRPPARQVCGSLDEARQWVEKEAGALNLPVQWVDRSA